MIAGLRRGVDCGTAMAFGTMLPLYQEIPAMPATPRTRMGRFHLDAPLRRVFPLFTAGGEREWAAGWDPVRGGAARM
jgi:hypothetical protein